MMTHRPVTRVSSNKKFSVSDRTILDRRVKTNPRYASVQSRTNTGFNTHRRQELDREIRKYYKVRQDEDFRRISLGDLIQLMVTHSIDAAAAEEEEEGREEEEEEEEEEGEKSHRFPLKYQDELKNVVHGMEHLMARGSTPPPLPPYLIIDIRATHHYHTSHLATALSHPSHRLSRAVGWESAPLLAHKNHPGSVIVLCDENEELSPVAASTLQHRGYGNVMMLSGGLRLARDKIGSPLVTETCQTDLPIQTALVLQDQLNVAVLPPLSVAEGPDWWASGGGGGGGGGATQATQRSGVGVKSRPWR